MKLYAIKRTHAYYLAPTWFDEDGVLNYQQWKKNLVIGITYLNKEACRKALSKISAMDRTGYNKVEIIEINREDL